MPFLARHKKILEAMMSGTPCINCKSTDTVAKCEDGKGKSVEMVCQKCKAGWMEKASC